MSDAQQIPLHADVEYYRRLAEELPQLLKGGSLDPGTARHWERFTRQRALSAPYKVEDTQCFIAARHGFGDWSAFLEHLRELRRPGSAIAKFEEAADAVVRGDLEALRRLLDTNPELTHMRSSREHRATLLHYTAANGVEDFRQKTPANVVAIAQVLLDSGADVNAEAHAYGAGATTLGLAATSAHPERAGVQVALLSALLDRGAEMDRPGSLVLSCLGNGRGGAAEFLAARGASLTLEGAAGVGRLDLVRELCDAAGNFPTPATARDTSQEMLRGFAWACQFGRTAVVAFLLDHGIDVTARLPHHGQTGLHWAAAGGHAETVRLLLTRGASVLAEDTAFGGTALGWAMHSFSDPFTPAPLERFHRVVELLIQAGAPVDPAWSRLDEVRADPVMLALLT